MSAALQQTKAATGKISYAVVPVDAATALRWLGRNMKNRNVLQSVVQRYRRDMAAGRWEDTGDPIRFDYFGSLIDGQHRLLALSEVDGLTLNLLVIRGLTPDSQRAMDQGRKRTPGDQLGLLGIKEANAVAAAVKKFIAWDGGMLFRDTNLTSNISSSEIEEWVQDHPEEIEALNPLLTFTKQNDAPPSINACAAIAFNGIDREATATFFSLLARGAGTEGHPIVALDKRLQRMRRENVKLPDREYLALFIVAWNAWRQGRTISKLQRPASGRFSEENFPQPK